MKGVTLHDRLFEIAYLPTKSKQSQAFLSKVSYGHYIILDHQKSMTSCVSFHCLLACLHKQEPNIAGCDWLDLDCNHMQHLRI